MFSVVFAPFAAFLVYYIRSRETGQALDLAAAFSILTIFRLVENPINVLLWACPQLASTLSCFDRIQQYLLSNPRHDNRLSLQDVYDSEEYWSAAPPGVDSIEMRRLGSVSRSPHEEALTLKNCSFGWKEEETPIVHDVDLSVRAGWVVSFPVLQHCTGKTRVLYDKGGSQHAIFVIIFRSSWDMF